MCWCTGELTISWDRSIMRRCNLRAYDGEAAFLSRQKSPCYMINRSGRGRVCGYVIAENGDRIHHPPALNPHTTHTSPRKPPTMGREIRPTTMFWKRLKLLDQKNVYHRMKMHHPIPARMDVTIGMSGLGCFSLMQIDSLAQ